MRALEFLSHLRSLGVELRVEGDHLRCHAPKGVLTEALRAELAARKGELTAFLHDLDGDGGDPAPPLQALPKGGPLPLSFAQQRLWFLDQLDPDNSTYNMRAAVRLTGPLDVIALERSLDEIVRRHGALRTTFAIVDGEPFQVIAPDLAVGLVVVDLQELSGNEQEGQAERLIADEARRLFDLAQEPLLRSTLVRLGPQIHILLLTMHHIVSDGWSMGVLYRELSSLYESFSQGNAPSLPEPPIQYADYAVWQRERLRGEVLDKQLAYWKQRLSDVPVLELPTDRPRPAVQTFRGARQSFALPKALSDGLKALSRREGATLFMTLLAGFQTLLHRYSGQDDIVVGSPIAGRNRVELEGLIGLFVNTLAMRADLSGDPTFKQLLGRVREGALEAYSHQELPFEKLVQELKPERDSSRNPLFQVMFAFQQDVAGRALRLAGLEVEPVKIPSDTAKFDLSLSVAEAAGSLKASFEYNTDLFEEATIQRMVGHFQTLLEGIVADPDQRLSELPLLTEAERHRLLVEWNETKRDYPKDKCIHELFEEQAERTPDAVAVVFPSAGSGQGEDQQLSYRELNQRANQLAHYLKRRGVGPESCVGIYMERSPEMVVGMLGILKAGGAYVPCDPGFPQERLGWMLGDSRARLLLAQKTLPEELPGWRGDVVSVDPNGKRFSSEPDDNPASGATAENLAYVIHTSGSTGKPKGVAIPHRAVTRLVVNTDYINLGSGDVVAQAANSAFDAATFEIWGALLHGARLVGIKTDVVLSPREFAGEIDRRKISALFLTTALFNLMARDAPAAFRNVRHLLFGGEAVNPQSVAEIWRHGPPQRLLHVYGPTETTTFASWHLVQSASEDAATIPIGRPIANTRIYLLDRHRRPVPVGVAGELYIGGDGLARGYLNQPEMTAESFVPDPFSPVLSPSTPLRIDSVEGDERGARLYKSGDFARYLPDGNVEFLGRVDDQVKIRGFRIEPGEIETALVQHPAVRQAVVVAREDLPGAKRLVAYLVSSEEPPPASRELRAILKQKLPDYMIPSLFVFLESFPLTPNGKVNRRALPLPVQTKPDNDPGYAPPAGVIEESLARIWEEILAVRPIGADDSFFDLGGHSLLAVRMMSRIEQACGQRLPLTTLLAGPTIKHLAEALRKQRVEDDRYLLVKVQSGGDKQPIFFLHGDFRRGGFFCLTLARGLGKDRPFYALAPHGLNGTAVPDTVEEMAASYLRVVRAVQPEGPYLLGGYCNGGTVAFEMAQQLRRGGQGVSLLVLVATAGQRALRKRLAHWVTHRVGGLFGLGSEEKLRLFLGLRAWVRFLQGRDRDPHEPSYEGIPRGHFPRLHVRSLSGYALKPYPGRIVLFWPNEQGVGHLKDPTFGWSRVVPQIEVQTVPGDHSSCLTKHVAVLADRMKACLEKAQRA